MMFRHITKHRIYPGIQLARNDIIVYPTMQILLQDLTISQSVLKYFVICLSVSLHYDTFFTSVTKEVLAKLSKHSYD